MKKILKICGIITALSLIPINSFAKCVDAPEMGNYFYRCESREAVCYANEGFGSISCFRK